MSLIQSNSIAASASVKKSNFLFEPEDRPIINTHLIARMAPEVNMSIQVTSNTHTLSKTSTSTLGQNIAAMVFGLIVLFAVGFAPMDVAHNAAHDTRHAHAFPCH